VASLGSADGKISVAVMPFKNLTSDTTFNIWQLGLQNLLITSLSNSEELSVRQFEIMDDILKGTGYVNYASITPSFDSDVALKTNPQDDELLASLYDTRGWGNYELGNYTQSLEDLQKGWSLRPFY
jgi:hypothetical protein